MQCTLYIKCDHYSNHLRGWRFYEPVILSFLPCLLSLEKPTDFTELPHLSPPLPLILYLSLPLPPPQPSIHSFWQRVWNMIALVVISGAFTLGIALCSTQYSDWNVGFKIQHSLTKCAIQQSWVWAHLRISAGYAAYYPQNTPCPWIFCSNASCNVLTVNNAHSFVHLFSPAHLLRPPLFTNSLLASWYSPLLNCLPLFSH